MVTYDKDGVMEFDLLEMFKLLWSKALSIILVSLITGAAVFAATLFFVKPTYEAKASMYVNNSSFTLGSTSFSLSSSEISASNSLVDAYIYILNSRTTLEEVIKDTGVDYTYEELIDNGIITTKSIANTAAFEIIVKSTDPTEAELIANSVARILPERVAQIVDGASLKIVDYAIIPSHRAGPSYTKNTVVGALIGAFLMCAIIVIKQIIKETQNNTVDSVDELSKMFSDIPIIAVIPDARYSKKNKYYSSYYKEEKGA